MKIGIDITPLTIPYQNGIKRYTKELIFALAKEDRLNEYLLFSTKKVKIPDQENFTLQVIPNFPIFKRQLILPYVLWRSNLGVYHQLEPYGSIFFKPVKTLTTIHDLNLTNIYSKKPDLGQLIRKYNLLLARYFILKNTDYFIIVSKTIKNELIKLKRRYGLLGPMKVLYEGVSNCFKVKNFVKRKQKYVLCMSDFSPRKNTINILRAMGILPPDLIKHYKLYIVVSSRNEVRRIKIMAKTFGLLEQIKIYIAPSDKSLANLYKYATCFLYPSLYEGFGLPIIEAMACGCPVITSNFGATKEISDNSAILVDPYSPGSIKEAIVKITSNKYYASNLAKRGLVTASKYTWGAVAKKQINLYMRFNKNK